MAYTFKDLTKAEFQEIAYGVGGEFDRVWTVCEAAVADGHKKVITIMKCIYGQI